MRTIDADKLKKVFNGYHSGIGSQPKFTLGACLQLIDNAPTVEPTFGLFRAMLCETCQAYATNRKIAKLAKLADENTRPQDQWIPVTYRPMTEEEVKEACEKWGINENVLEYTDKLVFTCPLPEDEQEILISHGSYVSEDTCSWDEDFCGLECFGDWVGVDAWMPKPEPYKKEGDGNND